MVTEGFDCPGIEAVQILRKTNSLALHIQMSTRGMTLDPNNPDKVAIILDHVGNTEELGMIDDDFKWSLIHPDDDLPPEEPEQKYVSNVKVCSECFHTYKSYLDCCPLCGNGGIKPFKPFKVINLELQAVKSINKKVRDLVGKK